MAYLNGRQIAFNPIVNSVVLDNEMSGSSINGVQNRVIKSYVDNHISYEYGTWTPSLVQTSETPYGSIESHDCSYWKFNNMVVIQGRFKVLNYENQNSNLNTFTFSGLPYIATTDSSRLLGFLANCDVNGDISDSIAAKGFTFDNLFAFDAAFNSDINNGDTFTIDFTLTFKIYQT